MEKRGWRDDSTPELEKMKADRGFSDRNDILTFLIFMMPMKGNHNIRLLLLWWWRTYRSFRPCDIFCKSNHLQPPAAKYPQMNAEAE